MSHLTLFLLILSISLSFCDCRIQPTKSNREGKWNGLLYSIETIPPNDQKSNQANKFDAIQELISGFRSLQTLYHGNSKGFNLKFKVMIPSIRHKLLEHVSKEGKSKFKDSRAVEELVAMDYMDPERGPSTHNR